MAVLLNVLKEVQEKEGYISEDALKRISIEYNIPISRLWGIATFYFLLHTKKMGKHVIHICDSPSCYVNGSLDLIKFLEKKLKIKLDETTKDRKFSLYASSCIGCCDHAPAMMIDGKAYTDLTEEKIEKIIGDLK